MTTSHLCLSTKIEQLGRWRQAFPYGQITDSVAAMATSRPAGLIWIHQAPGPENRIETSIGAARETHPTARIVVISNTPSQREALLALHHGASGYCHAQATPRLLQQVATVVTNGGLWIGAELMSRIFAATGQLQISAPEPAALNLLTQREREVALAVGRGISNKEVALQLHITERTVKAHLGAIFEKLEVRDRLQLVILLGRETGDRASNGEKAGSKSSLRHAQSIVPAS